MRALIFGGTGQDGQYLRGLLEGKSITVLSCGRHGGDFLVDVSDAIAARNVIREVKPDFIFHLAATSSTAKGCASNALRIRIPPVVGAGRT